jgi:hypothetical protein
VIAFPQPEKRGSPIKWRFFDYGDEIQIWYDGLTEDEQETLVALLKLNARLILRRDGAAAKCSKGKARKSRFGSGVFIQAGYSSGCLGFLAATEEKQFS